MHVPWYLWCSPPFVSILLRYAFLLFSLRILRGILITSERFRGFEEFIFIWKVQLMQTRANRQKENAADQLGHLGSTEYNDWIIIMILTIHRHMSFLMIFSFQFPVRWPLGKVDLTNRTQVIFRVRVVNFISPSHYNLSVVTPITGWTSMGYKPLSQIIA